MIDVDVTVWSAELVRLHERIAGRFRRSEPRRRAARYLFGLVGLPGHRNGWTLAERAGEPSPDGMQRLLRWADWDVDRVRDDVRDYVTEFLGEPHGVLIVGETGFPKKGVKSAGVARQFSAAAGCVENCQIGVFLAYGSGRGHALIDRRLYLPPAWTGDRDRCRDAGVPDEVGFATRADLARQMLAAAFAAGVPARWVTMDEAYGRSPSLRVWLEEQGHAYVVATGRDDSPGADELIAALPGWAWSRMSSEAGAGGPRDYCWARIARRDPPHAERRHWLLARRDEATGEVAYYACYGPRRTRLMELARVADRSRVAGTCLRQAKLETGLDEYQVRGWRPWYAHITLSMAAYAGLVVSGACSTKE